MISLTLKQSLPAGIHRWGQNYPSQDGQDARRDASGLLSNYFVHDLSQE